MLAPTVGPGIPVAHLTHCGQVAECVGSARRAVVGVPRSAQHRVAPGSGSMAGTHAHRAFALTSGTRIKSLPGSLRYSHDFKLLGPSRLCLPTPLVALYYRCVGNSSSCGRSDLNRHEVYALRKAPHPVPDRARLPFRHAREVGGQAGPCSPEDSTDHGQRHSCGRVSQLRRRHSVSFRALHVWGWTSGPGRMLSRHDPASGRYSFVKCGGGSCRRRRSRRLRHPRKVGRCSRHHSSRTGYGA